MLSYRSLWIVGAAWLLTLAQPGAARAGFTVFAGAGYEEGGYFSHHSASGNRLTGAGALVHADYDSTSLSDSFLSLDQTQIGLSLTNTVGLHMYARASVTGDIAFTSIARADLSFTDSLSVSVLPIDPLALVFASTLITRISVDGYTIGEASVGIRATSGETTVDWDGGSFLDLPVALHRSGFTYTTDPFTVTALAFARGAGPDGFGLAKFNSTVRIEGFTLLDDAGNPLPATFTSVSSGFNYRDLSVVPEPSTATLLLVGGLLAACRSRVSARRRGIRPWDAA